MAIKVNGTTVIDNNTSALNVSKITFADATEQTSAAVGGSLGTTVVEGGTLLYTLDNPNIATSGSDEFSRNAIAIDGNYAIVGAHYSDADGGFRSGTAYIYNIITGKLSNTLINPGNTVAGDRFGYSVGISGNYAIVGAYLEDDAQNDSGKAYIFDATTGSLVHTLDNPNAFSTSYGDNFGYSVAISGNYAIVGAHFEEDANGQYSGKAYIFDVTTGSLLHTLDNPNAYSTSAGDEFGYSVGISGNYAIVGAYAEDDASGTDSGKAYIFDVSDGSLVHTLDNPNPTGTGDGDFFGEVVAISGNYAIVGAKEEEYNVGRAYIFDVTTGSLVHTLDNPNAYSIGNDNFGSSVSISGNYAIVGAYAEDDATGTSSGKAYIFDVTEGSLVYTLDNPNAYSTSAGDEFGQSVAISGNYAIVGAYREDDAGGTNSGKAYIFSAADILQVNGVNELQFASGNVFTADQPLFGQAHTSGELLHVLDNPNAYSTSASDRFGGSGSLAADGNYAIITAMFEDEAGNFSSGKAYIFDVTTGSLLHTLDNPNAYSTSGNDYFASSVGISGNYAIVGARQEDDAGGTDSGKAYIFDVTSGSLLHILDNPNPYSTSDYDAFGYSVGISGNCAIVGAYQEDTPGINSGKAYIYDVTTGSLLHTLDNPNAYGIGDYDWFGYSVAISGNYAIVGAYGEDDAGGDQSGKAYIFDVTTGNLLYTIDNPNAYSTSAYDYFGYSVAISGNYAVVGAWQEGDAGGSGSGKAYIFDVTTGSLLHTLDNPNAYSTGGGDYFGNVVAVSDNYAIVGAYLEDDAGGPDSGKAYIFDVTTGTLVHTLDNPNAYSTSVNDQFGRSVALSGNYAFVTAYSEDDASGTSSGKVYIFSLKDQTYFDKLTALI